MASTSESLEQVDTALDVCITLDQAQALNTAYTKRKYDSAVANSMDTGKIHQAKFEYDYELKKKEMISDKIDEISENLGERKKAAGFPDRISDSEDVDDDEIPMEIISTKDDNRDEEKLTTDAVSSLSPAQYQLPEGEGEYWTVKHPDKDNIQPLMYQANDKENENISSMMNDAPVQGENAASGETGETSSKSYSVSTSRAGVRKADLNEKETTPGDAHRNHTSDMRKQNEATVGVTNLPEETQEENLRDLFTPIGPVNRIVLVKDKSNNTSKCSAFITFDHEKDAQNQ